MIIIDTASRCGEIISSLRKLLIHGYFQTPWGFSGAIPVGQRLCTNIVSIDLNVVLLDMVANLIGALRAIEGTVLAVQILDTGSRWRAIIISLRKLLIRGYIQTQWGFFGAIQVGQRLCTKYIISIHSI